MNNLNITLKNFKKIKAKTEKLNNKERFERLEMLENTINNAFFTSPKSFQDLAQFWEKLTEYLKLVNLYSEMKHKKYLRNFRKARKGKKTCILLGGLHFFI